MTGLVDRIDAEKTGCWLHYGTTRKAFSRHWAKTISASLLLTFAQIAAGATYYVDPILGNASHDALSPDRPRDTLRSVASLLKPGDRVRMRTDVAHGASQIPSSVKGSPEQPIVIEPYEGGGQILFDGRDRSPFGNARDFAVPYSGAWERVVGGHADEWRSTRKLDSRIVYGQFLDTRLRLLSYTQVEDFRAGNQSFVDAGVPLSDPRPGPISDRDPTRKMLWTYLGPGILWVPDDAAAPLGRGHVHIRLSKTRLRTPGAPDYADQANPNALSLGLSYEPDGDAAALVVGGQHIVLRNVAIQNGGAASLRIAQGAANVSFDHCEIYASRYGVRIPAGKDLTRVRHITFRHCLFDGGLAPWTTRVDVKTTYKYRDASGNSRENNLARKTADMLVIDQSEQAVFEHCTFRRGHDALQLGGVGTVVRDSLFEDMNDEVIQFNKARDARIHGNVLRQVLHPFSFALGGGGGPLYIYRNLIDQRVPVRGFRILPPDAPAPFVWRYGTDFKMANDPEDDAGDAGPSNAQDQMPAVRVYHNTFVASHPSDKAAMLSMLFSRSFSSPEADRVHLNNIRLGLELDVPLSWARPPDAKRASHGNLWHLYHRRDANWFLWQDGTGKQQSLENFSDAAANGWEVGSVNLPPRLRNFDDESFPHGPLPAIGYPNNDFRWSTEDSDQPVGAPLPAEYPDTTAGNGSGVGALGPMSSGFAVGVDGATRIPDPAVPIAHAGADQTVTDLDGDGFETITVDATGSKDPAGQPLTYEWHMNDARLSTKSKARFYLPEGDHTLRLHAANSQGQIDTDAVRVRIQPAQPHGDNLVLCPGFEESPCGWVRSLADVVATKPHSGRKALRMSGTDPAAAAQSVAVTSGSKYRVSIWIRCDCTVAGKARMRVRFDDPAGTEAQWDVVAPASSAYAYQSVQVQAPEGATRLQLALETGAAAGMLYFDDVRITDQNLIRNAGFETRPPNGRHTESPGWRFARGGEVSTASSDVRSGSRSLSLIGTTVYRQVEQNVAALPGVTRYRLSFWLKTSPSTDTPEVAIQPDTGSWINVPLQAGLEYGPHFRVIEVPAGSRQLTLRLRLPAGSPGHALFDDIALVPWTQE